MRRLWLDYGALWLGAIIVGLVSVLYAWFIDLGFELFRELCAKRPLLPLLLTPFIAACCCWLTRRFFAGAEGSGIPQVIATLGHPDRGLRRRLLSTRVLIGKILVSFLTLLGGMTFGREGPTVQIGAILMYSLRGVYRKRFRVIAGAALERRLVLVGAAAGLSAAFNTPLAGVVFAIEELARSFEPKSNGLLITTIIFAGIVSLGLNGNYVYFGRISIGAGISGMLPVAVVVTGIVCGVLGGLFCWIVLNSARWMPGPLRGLRDRWPVLFAGFCGLVVAIIGVSSHGQSFGSGYHEARGLLEGTEQLPVIYPLLKFLSMIGSYLSGAPGGIFAPSLSIGAGVGNTLHLFFTHAHEAFAGMSLPTLIGLAMVGYLAAVTQSPITAFVIVMEMIDGHALVISLMATALIASMVSRFFAPPLYEALSRRFLPSAKTTRSGGALTGGAPTGGAPTGSSPGAGPGDSRAGTDEGTHPQEGIRTFRG